MSLDVYLLAENTMSHTGSGIFVRQNGTNKEISREEWDEKFPDREPVIAQREDDNTVYNGNITHNLGKMARAAGIYEALWRPEEVAIIKAYQLIDVLGCGLFKLISRPDLFKEFNPENGWGSYEGLVEFVSNYLKACIDHPHATIKVWR